MLDDNKGNLYIGHHAENGMSILSLKTKKVKNFTHDPNNKKTLPHNNVQCIFKDNTGNIWAGTGRGLALFNPNTEEFIWLGEKNPSLSHLVYDIQQFNENQLWVATELGGIAIIDLSKTLFNTAEEIHVIQAGNNEHNLNNSTVRCLFQDSHQNIWLEPGEEASTSSVRMVLYLSHLAIRPIRQKALSAHKLPVLSVSINRDYYGLAQMEEELIY